MQSLLELYLIFFVIVFAHLCICICDVVEILVQLGLGVYWEAAAGDENQCTA